MNKIECPKCERLLRARCFVKNPLINNLLCKRCDRKIGHNKFYEEQPKLNKRFWSRKETNKQILYNNFKNMGLSHEEASKRVYQHMKYFKSKYKKDNSKKITNEVNQLKEKINNQKFKESLKNLK